MTHRTSYLVISLVCFAIAFVIAVAWAQTSPRANRSLEQMTFDASGKLETTASPSAASVQEVEGDEAEASTAAVNPVVIGGRAGGGTGAVRALSTGASGSVLDVDVEIIGTAATITGGVAGETADFTLVAAAANTRLMHWSCRESAGTAAVATVILRHDTVATTCDGSVFAFVELAANESAGDQYGPRGLNAASGICMDVLAGTVDCSVSTVVEAAP